MNSKAEVPKTLVQRVSAHTLANAGAWFCFIMNGAFTGGGGSACISSRKPRHEHRFLTESQKSSTSWSANNLTIFDVEADEDERLDEGTAAA